MQPLIDKLLGECDPDIQAAMRTPVVGEIGTFLTWQLLPDPAMTVLQWQLMRDTRKAYWGAFFHDEGEL